MDTESLTRSPDRVIADLASRQHGVVARRQLMDAGLSSTVIGRRLRNGRLHQVHLGVYLVGHAVAPALAVEQAALLACGDDAALSHRSAAALWKLLPYPASSTACVTIPPGRSAARPGIELHRARLTRRDTRRRHGLALTSPPRTILDLSGSLDREILEALVGEAHYRGLASDRELGDQLARNPGMRGSRALRAILDLPGGPRRTRPPAEREMLALLRRSDLTGYETNGTIHGYEVDLLWREAGLVVEIDGYDAHSGSVAFERDRLKTATLNAHGLTVMPVTGRQVRNDPAGVLQRLQGALKLADRRTG